jgi:undecaprenyl-diphosphatase
MGVLFEDGFESMFGSLRNVGYELLATALILWLTRYCQTHQKEMKEGRYLDFLIIGITQGISIVPGISRSGITIAAALFLGFKREDAFRFSFLLAIPAILGAGLIEAGNGILHWEWGWEILAMGFVVALVSGYFSLFFLARVTQKGKLHLFSFYAFAFGILILFLAGRFE